MQHEGGRKWARACDSLRYVYVALSSLGANSLTAVDAFLPASSELSGLTFFARSIITLCKKEKQNA